MIVPDVVGLPFHMGRDLAMEAGVSLANPDPDGPPIGALAWPGLFWIVSQDPAPGTRLPRWDSVRVEIRKDEGPDAAAMVREPPPAGSRQDARAAEPED